MTHDFLLEIGLEEIPARMIFASEKQLKERVENYLKEGRLAFETVTSYSTPRRLAVSVQGVAEKQEDMTEVLRGPAKRIAQDAEGNWTKAAEGFTRGQGLTTDDIYFESEGDEEYVYVTKQTDGLEALKVLEGLSEVITSMTFPVTMRWGSNTFEYIRPIHWIVALLDDQVIPLHVLDVRSDRQTEGHRFLGKRVSLNHATDYELALENEYVIVDPAKRQQFIIDQIKILEEDGQMIVDRDKDLLDEVTNLVEYPTAFQATFDEKYLELPEEILITSMKDHQRYFSVRDEEGTLLPHFIAVRNGNDFKIDQVAEGNEKVLRARLDDAFFFFEEDQKLSIDEYIWRLSGVTFLESLGHMADKTKRIRKIAEVLGKEIDLSKDKLADLDRAAEISKFDLETLMVSEFTELQGVIGGIYAEKMGENAAVSQAVGEQYMPVTSDGKLPESTLGAVLSIADKLDNILMFIAAGKMPSSSNDPHGLRRQALGILRIINENNWSIKIDRLIQEISELIKYPSDQIAQAFKDEQENMLDFLKSRVRQVLEAREVPYDVIQAVLSSTQNDFNHLIINAEELAKHRVDVDFKDVVENLTRVVNLRGKIIEEGADQIDIKEELLESESEKVLYQEINRLEEKITDETSGREYYQALADLKYYIVEFFENNMIMADDKEVRLNRLALLSKIGRMIRSFAEVGQLVIK